MNEQEKMQQIIYDLLNAETKSVSLLTTHKPKEKGGCPGGKMVKSMDCGIVVREFVLQSRYCVHFRANTLGKGMNPLILLTIG